MPSSLKDPKFWAAFSIGTALAVTAVISLVVIIIYAMRDNVGDVVIQDATFKIDSTNNHFQYQEQGSSVQDVIVTNGTYTGIELAELLQTKLNAHGNWTVLWNPSQRTFTIGTDDFFWDRCEEETGIYKTIGLKTDTNNGCGKYFRKEEIGEPV